MQGGRYPYVYMDSLYLSRNWGGEYENVAILVAIAVNEDDFCEVLGAAEGMKEDKVSWANFFQWLRGCGLDGVKLIKIFSVVPKSKVKIVVKMLKTLHAYESKKASRDFVFQFIDRHLLRVPEHYSVGKLRSFPTLLSHA